MRGNPLRRLVRPLRVLVLAGVVGSVGCGPRTPAPASWTPLFNGQDLTGWTAKIRGSPLGEDPHGTFRVEDGLLTVGYDGYERFDERFGHLFYEAPFSSYELRVEYRFIGEQVADGPGWALANSGVMIHAQSPESMGLDQDFPIAIEVQLLGGNGVDERHTANLCTPGTHVEMAGQLVEQHCVESTSRTYHGDEWVTLDVLVLGDSLIAHVLEGDTVLSYGRPVVGGGVVSGFEPSAKRDGQPLTGGYIALQSESHPVQFRQVLIRELNPPGAAPPR